MKWSSLGIGYESFNYSAIILDRSSLQKYLTCTCGTFLTFRHVCSYQSYFFKVILFLILKRRKAQRATETEEQKRTKIRARKIKRKETVVKHTEGSTREPSLQDTEEQVV